MKRRISFVLFIIMAVMLLAGCGSISHELTARSRADMYIRDKYGFSAAVKQVVLSDNSWLEFSFEAPSFANVRMEYDGREFDVLVPIRSDDEVMYADNYEQDVICAEIERYIRDTLDCEKLTIRIDYGVYYGIHLLPKDIRSADDLIKSKNDKNIKVYTYGLDFGSVAKLDTTRYGERTYLGIADFLDPELPEPEYGVMRELPDSGGWNVGAIIYTEGGELKQTLYERTVIDNVCLVMPAECGVVLEKSDGKGKPDDESVTDWYSMRGTGEGYGILYTSVQDCSAEYCIEYIQGGEAYYMRMPHVNADGAEYELSSDRYCSGSGDEFVFRVVKRDFYKDREPD